MSTERQPLQSATISPQTPGVLARVDKKYNSLRERFDPQVEVAKSFVKTASLVAAVALVTHLAGSTESNESSTALSTAGADEDNNPIVLPQEKEVHYTELEQTIVNKISRYFDPAVTYWTDDIMRWATMYGVHPIDVATIMQIESCGNPKVVSSSDARGIFQVVPKYHLPEGMNPDALFDPDVNAAFGLTYFAKLRDQSGDLGKAYKGYNGGPSAMGKVPFPGSQVDRYHTWSGMRVQADNGEESTILDAWYEAGGKDLCRKARERLDLPLTGVPFE